VVFRLGFLGAGSHAGRSHGLPGIQTGEFSVVAVFDPKAESVQKFRQKLGQNVPDYGTAAAVVNHPEVDAIVIASIDDAHPGQLALAVDAGKPVFCEKPLAVTQEGLVIVHRALVAAERNNVLVTTCHPRNEVENGPYTWVRNVLGNYEGRYGALEHIELNFTYQATETQWKKEGRSLLLDHWGHEVGFMMKLFSLQPFMAMQLADSPDHYAVAGRLNEGVTFFCSGSRRLTTEHYPETITLRFARGTVTVYTLTGKTVFYDHETLEVTFGMATPLSYDETFTGVMKRFARELKTGRSAFSFPELRLIAESGVRLASAVPGPHHFTVR